MADRYLLESGAPDGYLLEDGTGVLLLEPFVSTLTDNFDDNSIDTAKWSVGQIVSGSWTTTGCTVAETNQRLEVTLAASATNRGDGYVSVGTYSLSDDAVFVKVPNVASLQTGEVVRLTFGAGFNATIVVFNGSVLAGEANGAPGANTSFGTDVWFRLRHDAPTDTLKIDTAPATASDPPASGDWVNRVSWTRDPTTVLSGQVAFSVDANGTGPATPTTVQFDGFNTATTTGGTQTLTPSLFTNTQTFYAPTVTPGSFTLTPSLFTNSQTFYTPTVSRGSVTLTPSLFTNSQSFFAPTVSPGVVTLTPNLFTNSQSFFSPTITPGVVTLTPLLFTNSQTFFSPTVAGVVILTPSLFTNSQTFYSPTVSPGSVTLAPNLFTNSQTFFSPAVQPGMVTLLPSLFTNVETFFSPTVVPGQVTLLPALFTNSQIFYSPTVALTINLFPDLFTNSQTFFSPTVTQIAVVFVNESKFIKDFAGDFFR